MKVHLVQETEHERGWGSRVEDYYAFPTQELAEQFCKEYNKKYNNSHTVPDWYMTQRYIGESTLTEEKFNRYKYKGNLVDIPINWEFNNIVKTTTKSNIIKALRQKCKVNYRLSQQPNLVYNLKDICEFNKLYSKTQDYEFSILETHCEISKDKVFEYIKKGNIECIKTATSDIENYGFNDLNCSNFNVLSDNSDTIFYEKLTIGRPNWYSLKDDINE